MVRSAHGADAGFAALSGGGDGLVFTARVIPGFRAAGDLSALWAIERSAWHLQFAEGRLEFFSRDASTNWRAAVLDCGGGDFAKRGDVRLLSLVSFCGDSAEREGRLTV